MWHMSVTLLKQKSKHQAFLKGVHALTQWQSCVAQQRTKQASGVLCGSCVKSSKVVRFDEWAREIKTHQSGNKKQSRRRAEDIIPELAQSLSESESDDRNERALKLESSGARWAVGRSVSVGGLHSRGEQWTGAACGVCIRGCFACSGNKLRLLGFAAAAPY